MNQLLNLFFRKKTLTRDEILNLAVDLALEWGQNWFQPIQVRLAKKLPLLSSSDLDEYNEKSKEVLKAGFDFISSNLESLNNKRETVSELNLKKAFDSEMLCHYSWINRSNLKRIFNQGLYYTWKEGLNDCIK